jgi:site-specific recombinase XerD
MSASGRITELALPKLPDGIGLPALIAGAGKPAALRFLEFFTVNIRNRNTRAAYARAAGDFLRWCEGQGIGELGRIQPVHVAAYIEQLLREMSPPSVKQHLAGIRMMFDWLVTGQVVPSNPAHSVRGPRHSVSKGVTPVLSSEEATALLGGMDVSTVVGLRESTTMIVSALKTRSWATPTSLHRASVSTTYSGM